MAVFILQNLLSFPLAVVANLGAKTCMLLFCYNLSHNCMVFRNGRLPLDRSNDTRLGSLRFALVQNSELESYLSLHNVIMVDILPQKDTG
jgi:hypothetical protein